MSHLPWLSILWLTPGGGAAVIALLPATMRTFAKWLGLGTAMAVLAVSVVLAARFDTSCAPYQFVESHRWIPEFGASYTLGVDGIAMVLVLLTAALLPLLIIAGWNDGDARVRGPQSYVALMLAVESMVLISLTSLDILLFYVFFEAMLIPMYFMVGAFGPGEHRSRAALKFLLYNLFGGLVMLAAVIGLYVVTAQKGIGTFDFRAIVTAVASGSLHVDPGAKRLVRRLFVRVRRESPTVAVSHLAARGGHRSHTGHRGVDDGGDGQGRHLWYAALLPAIIPGASTYFRPAIITLAVVGIIYGAVVAIGQTDIMRLIAYASISHFGFIILGIFVMTTQGQSGSTLYMVNHGLSTAALLLTAGFLISRRGSRAIAAYGGVQKVAPLLAGTFLVAALATLALPGLAPFISEFLVLIGTFNRYWLAAVFGATSLVLSSIYMLWLYQRVMTGPVANGNERIRDLIPAKSSSWHP
ncbi:proton-translocating NADH-quinone oxidoreductase, chain M family protein [Mycobacterium xenopi 3993]|nr:proton-translocating NADH-quinone oxidoreductase, chain M family protein [Mycobacterium xenopi 3993]